MATIFDVPIFFAPGLIAEIVNWLAGRAPQLPLKCQAIIRYQHPAAPGVLKKVGTKWQFIFKQAQRAVTPGQSVVFYQGQKVIGGGLIKRAL